MKNLKIKVSVILRICALVAALLNQCLAIFGKSSFAFVDTIAYQITSLVVTVIVAGINCWYNQDVTKIALLAGKLFDSMRDGNISKDEIESIVRSAEDEEIVSNCDDNAFLIGFANGVINTVKKASGESAKKEDTQE